MTAAADALLRDLLSGVKRYVVEEEGRTVIRDPVFGIVRNRVHAEVGRALLRIGERDLAERLIRTLVAAQNPDGSWNEIHPRYDQPAALETAFAGLTLAALPHGSTRDALERARAYVLSQELRPGYYRKSLHYTADHLNVDASCGAFLAVYGARFHDDACCAAAERAARHICSHQVKGIYPYAIDRGSYPSLWNVPCIHYQGVTLYYLFWIARTLPEPWLLTSLQEGVERLASWQNPDGSFDWSHSGLPFAYRLSGAPAFAYASFTAACAFDERYRTHADLCLEELRRNRNGIMLRWERGSWRSLPSSLATAAALARNHPAPLREEAFQFGYGAYREISRRRIRATAEERVFSLLCRILRLHPSTIEPSANFPDMFMTSEVVDCVSFPRAQEYDP